MSSRSIDLFAGSPRLEMGEALELTIASLQAHALEHPHWCIAWSGGKDSTATLTLILHLIEAGRVPRPQTLTVLYADTRQELPPLAIAAAAIMDQIRSRYGDWVRVEVARAPLDKRFLVYILGRGVPPPNNNTLRWCTRQIKVDPMAQAIEQVLPVEGTVLTVTGVRQGESAIRDKRIEMSCGKDGAECGQGWYQQALPDAAGNRGRISTLAPLLHWRVCQVWDWLRIYAPQPEFGGWPTAILAEAYGGDDAEEVNARTGCTGCPLASKDLALDAIVARPAWSYLAPLKRLKPIYRRLRLPENRLRKPGRELRKDGTAAANPQRLGPITFAARELALRDILAIQAECNAAAAALGRPGVDFLNAEEETRIRELITAETWPNGWDGDEPTGDVMLEQIFRDGTVQQLLFGVPA
jgi:DNA sulfur modification protein DndC